MSSSMPAPAPPAGSQRNRVLSYSQPLPRDSDISGRGLRRGIAMKNCAEDEKIPRSLSSSDNEYSTADDWDDDQGGGHEAPGIPHHSHDQHIRSCQSLPSPVETSRNRQHFPQQSHHLPQSYYQQFGRGVRISDAPLSLGRRSSSGASSPPKISSAAGTGPPVPEFRGAGGGQGIFKLPLRAPVHPLRPPSLDLRPHPLRETQAGSFLRALACTNSQLWAGQESGVRFWNFSDMFLGPEGRGRRVRGDEETSPFRVSVQTSPTLCLVVDAAMNLVWTGHKDGRIRSWRMEQPVDQTPCATFDSSAPSTMRSFKECLAWQAHRYPVLSLIITSYGDIWSGSEGGVIKVWLSEAVEKFLSFPEEERHMAPLLAERSFIDLRANVTVGGVCALPASDIKHLLSDNSRSKVWSGGYISFAQWDSRTKELLKVFAIDGQVDNRTDILIVNDPYSEDETKVKLTTTSKKEKAQGSVSFFQRSRNALIGAADAVRRVAVKSNFGDDSRRAEALAISADGMIWMGCANGYIVQWDGDGNRLQEFHYGNSPVMCLCTFGSRLWAGCANGSMQVLNLEGNLIGSWAAHSSPVIKMAVGNGFVFSLANHGGIRGWSMMSPGPLDYILLAELTDRQILYTKRENLRVLAGTWNVGQERACPDSLIAWLGGAASEVGVVVVGLQEVEMGAGFLAMAAAKETVGLEGSANGQWWLDAIGKTLDEGTSFVRVGSRQLAGLLVAVWARKSLRTHIGDVDAAAVPCGFGRAIGNKGAVGLRIRIYDRIMCFVNCHFAAHLEAVNRRNADFDYVYRMMTFTRPSLTLNPTNAGASSSVQPSRGSNDDDGRPDLAEADMLIFLGDFNYRLHGTSYDEARDFVSQRCFDWLRERDQLRAEMKLGKVFQGMREGQIKFPPTYKFERHIAGLSGYDSSEKKRIPAWCDRILYRDSRFVCSSVCSLDCPVVSSISLYDACMEVTDSDHKPVRCILNMDIARMDEVNKRQHYGEILSSDKRISAPLDDLRAVPETIVSTNSIILQNPDPTLLRITNVSPSRTCVFDITCERQSTLHDDNYSNNDDGSLHRSFGFPRWLEVGPAGGMIGPGQTVEVSVQHKELRTLAEYVDGAADRWWEEEVRDKAVVLLVHVKGEFSQEKHTHRVDVSHFSSRVSRSSQRVQSTLLHRADFRRLLSSDIEDEIRLMRGE